MCLRLCPYVHFAGKEQTPPPPFYLLGWHRAKEGPERAGGSLGFRPHPWRLSKRTRLNIKKASETTERYTNTPEEETKGSILKATEPVSEWVCCFVWHCDVCKCLCVFACVRVWASSVQDSALIAQGSCRHKL